MKKFLTVLCAATMLSGCVSAPAGNSMIAGKVMVLNEYGKDITQYCRKVIKRGGVFAQSAAVGVSELEHITCINGGDIYRIKGNLLTVDVPAENTTVDFGSVTIALNGDASFTVSGGNGKLKVGDTTKGWSKHDVRSIGR